MSRLDFRYDLSRDLALTQDMVRRFLEMKEVAVALTDADLIPVAVAAEKCDGGGGGGSCGSCRVADDERG
jgi:hypothetical protein